jgi:hypothetical protein
MGAFLPDASNSAQIAMLGCHDDSSGGLADLKAAMEAKAASLSGPLSRFGPDYVDERAEAEADRIGKRFSGAANVEDLKSRMGSALGADFSNVRFHTGADATAMAESADANAFTTGRDIYLGGPFRASTAAHEMVHTIQQGAVEASAPVMSAPAGSVQYEYKERSRFKNNPIHWLKKKTIGAHQKALDQITEHREDFEKMNLFQRAKWAAKNPLAYIRGRSGAGLQTKGDEKRQKKVKAEDDAVKHFQTDSKAQALAWGEGDLGDALKPQTAPPSDAHEHGTFGGLVEKAAGKAEKVNSDFGTGTGLSWSGTPLEITGLVDSGVKINQYKDALKWGTKLNAKDLDGLKGMDPVNGVAGGLSLIGDTASLAGNVLDAHKQRKQGNHWATAGSSINAIADITAMGGDVMSMIPVGPCGVVGSGLSGISNTLKAGVSFGSAIGNTHTQRKMRQRRDAYKEEAKNLRMPADRSDANAMADYKYKKNRWKTAEQARKAARIRKNEGIVGGVSSGVKAAANFTAMGLGTAALVGSCGVLDPVSGIVNSLGTAAGAVTDSVGGRVLKHQKRQMRRETVEEELDLENKIKALMNGDKNMLTRFGLTKAQADGLSYSQAKHIILKSMGFKSGKRKEAFNQITMNRAKALADRANTPGNDEEVQIMKEMFLGKDSNGKYNVQAIAEKLGLEEMEDPEEAANPFKKHRRHNP